MRKLKLIRDGMNLPFRLQSHGPDGPVLTGVYRPMTRAEVGDLMRETADLTGKERIRFLAGKIAARLQAWDCEDGPPSAENVAAMPPAFFDGLEAVVTGYAKSGADDEKKSDSPQP